MTRTTQAHASPELDDPSANADGEQLDPWPVGERVGVGQAAARHPFLVAIPVVICVVAALVVGLSRSPSYTAKTRMRVAAINLGAPGALSGLATASQSLATTYALSVDADGVIRPAARRLRLAPNKLRQAVSGTPVPQSPVFTITATGQNSERTRLVANSVSESLTRFVATQTTRRSPDDLLAEYRDKAAVLNRARLSATSAEQDYGDVPSGPNRRRLERARTALATAELEAGTAEAAFRNARINSNPQPRVEILRRAESASSDRSSKLQIFVFGGLVAGLMIGLALATFVANRAPRRSLGA